MGRALRSVGLSGVVDEPSIRGSATVAARIERARDV
jgi:hypothetical protein